MFSSVAPRNWFWNGKIREIFPFWSPEPNTCLPRETQPFRDCKSEYTTRIHRFAQNLRLMVVRRSTPWYVRLPRTTLPPFEDTEQLEVRLAWRPDLKHLHPWFTLFFTWHNYIFLLCWLMICVACTVETKLFSNNGAKEHRCQTIGQLQRLLTFE